MSLLGVPHSEKRRAAVHFPPELPPTPLVHWLAFRLVDAGRRWRVML